MKSLLMALVLLMNVVALAATPAPQTKGNLSTKGPKLDVKTEHNFSDLLINGKYQYPDEALVKVDDDKMLTDLIGYRKNFKDRLSRMGSGSGMQE